jgi:hypothetical protein
MLKREYEISFLIHAQKKKYIITLINDAFSNLDYMVNNDWHFRTFPLSFQSNTGTVKEVIHLE